MKNFSDRHPAPTHGHVGISAAEGDLVSLNFFMMVDGPTKVVMNMGMINEMGNLFHRFDRIKAVKERSHIEMANIKINFYIGSTDPVHLILKQFYLLSITIRAVIEIWSSIFYADRHVWIILGKTEDLLPLDLHKTMSQIFLNGMPILDREDLFWDEASCMVY